MATLVSGRVSFLFKFWLVVFSHPSEKYARQNGFIFPKVRDENKKYLKPPPSYRFFLNSGDGC